MLTRPTLIGLPRNNPEPLFSILLAAVLTEESEADDCILVGSKVKAHGLYSGSIGKTTRSSPENDFSDFVRIDPTKSA